MFRNASEHDRSKQTGWDLRWNALDPADLLFCALWLYMHDYIIAIILLLSCVNTYNHLLYFCAGSTPKIANKNTLNKDLCQVSEPFPSINYVWYMFDAGGKHTPGLYFKGSSYIFEMITFGKRPQTKLASMTLLKKTTLVNTVAWSGRTVRK